MHIVTSVPVYVVHYIIIYQKCHDLKWPMLKPDHEFE